MTPRLSRPALVVAGVSLAAGLLSGFALYGRSPEKAHVDGTAAWIPHLIITAVVVVWFVLAARRSPYGWRVVLAPLARATSQRVLATFRSVAGPVGLLRCLAVAFLLFFEAYLAWRIGTQVIAGLDPNFTANAWGGPGYVGALYCHYIDGALICTVCHLLLIAVTRPSRDRQHQDA
ncbi:hypothetical protein [Cryptosporangium phraense]|uniref:Uncharacterized protein n=1 Tax=Cryptosporangium phraense TaxID=2593070 RepID=A0A545AI20_9ACTN|nr:hypothetical protein [Cryptosporangium phraense]TQS40966.1 hypothetical protein FL583_31785 [Cryptosporangium phraense]